MNREGASDAGLRAEIEELYFDYAEAIDEDHVERWPDLFVDDCLYKIVSRENHERGLPLAAMMCESKGMLCDRVTTIRQTQMFAPRAIRHLISNIRIGAVEPEGLHAGANYLVLQTLIDDETRIFNAGRYDDLLVRVEGRLKFKRRICVYDTVLIPNSIIYPI